MASSLALIDIVGSGWFGKDQSSASRRERRTVRSSLRQNARACAPGFRQKGDLVVPELPAVEPTQAKRETSTPECCWNSHRRRGGCGGSAFLPDSNGGAGNRSSALP